VGAAVAGRVHMGTWMADLCPCQRSGSRAWPTHDNTDFMGIYEGSVQTARGPGCTIVPSEIPGSVGEARTVRGGGTNLLVSLYWSIYTNSVPR
jgi:hypothetical protein